MEQSEDRVLVLIERMSHKLEDLETKIDEIMLAIVPEEELTEEERDIIRRGREEIKRGEYKTLEDVSDIFE